MIDGGLSLFDGACCPCCPHCLAGLPPNARSLYSRAPVHRRSSSAPTYALHLPPSGTHHLACHSSGECASVLFLIRLSVVPSANEGPPGRRHPRVGGWSRCGGALTHPPQQTVLGSRLYACRMPQGYHRSAASRPQYLSPAPAAACRRPRALPFCCLPPPCHPCVGVPAIEACCVLSCSTTASWQHAKRQHSELVAPSMPALWLTNPLATRACSPTRLPLVQTAPKRADTPQHTQPCLRRSRSTPCGRRPSRS